MLQKWKCATDNKKSFAEILTDLSKAFHCLSRYLLSAKLNTYWFSISTLGFVLSYLKNRMQSAKIKYSSCKEIMFGFYRGLYLGLNCSTCSYLILFFVMGNIDVANYADDSTPYTAGKFNWGSNSKTITFSQINWCLHEGGPIIKEVL